MMSAATDTQPSTRRHPQLFFMLALGWFWLLWIPVVLLGVSQAAFPGILLYALGGLGPPLAAIFLLPLALNALGILTGVLLGAPLPPSGRAAELFANPLSIVPFILVVLLFGPLPEELGWPRVRPRWPPGDRSALSASLVLGTIWALWHWPQFFMQDSYIGEVFPIGTGVFWVGWVLPTVAYSVIYTWIYNHTGRSILAAILLHFMVNFWGELLTVRGETVIFRSIWLVVLAIAIVLV